jgi:hypothetical protein
MPEQAFIYTLSFSDGVDMIIFTKKMTNIVQGRKSGEHNKDSRYIILVVLKLSMLIFPIIIKEHPLDILLNYFA